MPFFVLSPIVVNTIQLLVTSIYNTSGPKTRTNVRFVCCTKVKFKADNLSSWSGEHTRLENGYDKATQRHFYSTGGKTPSGDVVGQSKNDKSDHSSWGEGMVPRLICGLGPTLALSAR
jgi:hypothetical protein